MTDDTALANSTQYLSQALGKVASLYNQIAESITEEDIAMMSTKDKINALGKLAYVHTMSKKTKANVKIFNLNPSKASVEELENALININNEDEE